MASSVLLWLACTAAAVCPPLCGCALAVFVSPSLSNFLLLLAGLSWSIQLLGWLWSAAHHSERYYDLLGSLTFISLVLVSLLNSVAGPSLFPSLLVSSPSLLARGKSDFSLSTLWAQASDLNARQLINSLLVLVWATRLGSHLFSRIRKDNKDARFDLMRDSGAKLLLPWMTQGLWAFSLSLPVTLTNALFAADQSTFTAASTVVGSSYNAAAAHQLTLRDAVGWSIWLGAFLLEVVADRQKASFAADEANKGKFIDQGLWSLSRHPNYLGEMSMWFGLFLSCSSAFTAGSHYLCIAGPCFNAFLLLFVSGIPLLEKSSEKKFGKNPAYQQYKQRTPVLIPKLSAVAALFQQKDKPSSGGKHKPKAQRDGSALR